MLPSRTLRWTGLGISNGRQRLLLRNSGARSFSINTAGAYSNRVPRIQASKNVFSQQSRSISLFGWGNSSKPSSDTVSGSTAEVNIGADTSGLDNVRTIKASSATADTPDFSQAHHHSPSSVEPQFIENLQEKLTLPHGSTSEQVAGIMTGETDINSVAERMGYLKEVCGLDFGWGPSAMMETALESLHIHAGLSWTASIIVLGAALRIAMFHPMLLSQKEGRKIREMNPFIQPLRTEYMALMKEGNQAKAQQIAQEMREITKSFNVSYSKMFVPLLVQLPFSFGAFRVLRNCGQLPVPGFVTEQWLWATDLSFGDPYFIVPAISAAAIYFTFKLQSKSPNAMMGPQVLKLMGTALPAFSFAFMCWQPGSVQLYFMVTGIFAYFSAALLRQRWLRNYADLGPLPEDIPQTPTPSATGTSSTGPSASTVKKYPANMRIIDTTARSAPAASTTTTTETVSSSSSSSSSPTPGSDRSAIDRAMDKGKDWWKDNTAYVREKTKERQARSDEDQVKAAASRYQAQRQLQLDREREERNQKARGQQG